MFKGRIILVALAVLLIASAAFGQVVKYPVGSAGVGTAVAGDGEAAAARDSVVGIVIYSDGSSEAMFANSGVYDFTDTEMGLPDTPVAGEKFFWSGSAWVLMEDVFDGTTSALENEGNYHVIYLSEPSTDVHRVMIDIQSNAAYQIGFDNSTTGLTLLSGETVSNVQEAIDALAEASSGLRNDKATGIATVLNEAATPDYGTEIASLALGTLTNGVPLMVHFAGVFNDKGTNNGAIIDVQLQVDDSPIGETNRQVFLTDLQFYQQQEVTITGKYTPTAADESGVFSVNASTNDAYDGGQSVAGELFVWEVSN